MLGNLRPISSKSPSPSFVAITDIHPSAILGAIGASAACAATGAAAEFDAPAAAVICGGVVPPAIVNAAIQCADCMVIGQCPNPDPDAQHNACDWRGGDTRLGPNQCLQHKSGVPRPDKNTDIGIDGNLIVHCHNTAAGESRSFSLFVLWLCFGGV